MSFRAVGVAVMVLLISACGNGIDQAGNALTGDGVDPSSGTPGTGDWVALSPLHTTYNSNSIGTVRFKASDQNGAPFDGLRASDFEILEDGSLLATSDSQVVLEHFAQLSGQLDTVLLLDVSASLDAASLSVLKQAVRTALIERDGSRGLLVGQRMALYTFDSRVRRVVDFTDDTGLLLRALDGIERSVSPSADLFGAVAQGVGLVESSFGGDRLRTGAVIVVTDGRDTANRSTLPVVLSAIQGKSVYSVGVGADADSETLALIGNAGSLSVSDFGALGGALLTVRSLMLKETHSLYELRYASPKRRAAGGIQDSAHRLELRVHNNANASGTSRVTADFNSYDFGDVRPEVRILGDRFLNVGETVSFNAKTDWAADVQPRYSWSLSGLGCALESTSEHAVTVVGVQRGECQLLAVDTAVSASTAVTLDVEQVVVEF